MLVSQRVTRNVNTEMEKKLTVGQRIADRVAAFGGSWRFIILYSSILFVWMAANTFSLARYSSGAQFDPSLHFAESHALNDGGDASAGDLDVAKPGNRERSFR